MIDWITAIIPCRHPTEIHGGHFAAISVDGVVEWRKLRAESVIGSHDSHFFVQSKGLDALWISGNPAKWLQGHNLFGTDDMRALVIAVSKRIAAILRINAALSDRRKWVLGGYDLLRVDCTAMWELRLRVDVRAWIRAAEMQARSRHGRPMSRGGTVYFGKHSRRWALKFYSKGDELDARGDGHALPSTIDHRDKLTAFADNKLRGELTLRSMQLKKLGLDRGAAWNSGTSQRLLLQHIGSLQMADQFSLTPSAIDGLAPRLVLVYEAWKRGKDLRQMFALRTFYRYRKELRKHGIDISIRQPAIPDNVIPLVRVLRPEAIAQVPEWAIGTNLYFDPFRRLRKEAL